MPLSLALLAQGQRAPSSPTRCCPPRRSPRRGLRRSPDGSPLRWPRSRRRSLSLPLSAGSRRENPPHPPIEPRRWNPGFPRFFGSLETCLTSTVKILQIAETVFPLLNQVVGIMNVGHERGVVCAGERRLRGDARRGLEERRRASGAWIQTRIPPTRPIEPHHDPPRPPENGRRKQSLPHATSGKRFPIYTTLPVVGRLVSPLRQ